MKSLSYYFSSYYVLFLLERNFALTKNVLYKHEMLLVLRTRRARLIFL